MELICILCPRGCHLQAELRDGQVVVSGNSCPRGERYGQEELTHPVRTVTSSVYVANGKGKMLSVKTNRPVAKASIPMVLEALADLQVAAPIRVGDVILGDVAGTGADIVATRNVPIV